MIREDAKEFFWVFILTMVLVAALFRLIGFAFVFGFQSAHV